MPDWKSFNQWEEERLKEVLPKLAIEASFRQFCQIWKASMLLAQAGNNYEYLSNVETNPHLRDLLRWKELLQKAKVKC